MSDIASGYRAQGAVDTTYGFKHAMSRPRPLNAGRPIFGLPSVGVGADGTMAAYEAVAVPRSTRTKRLKSEQEINTELYGTAPYLGQGDGVMLHPEVSTRLRNSLHITRGSKARHLITERNPNRWEFIKDRNVVQTVTDQVGVSTRVDPVYK